FREPELLGRQVLGLEVEDPVVRDGRREAVRLPEEPVDRVSAVARAGDAESVAVDERLLRDRVEDRGEVLHDLAAPVLRDLVHELLPEAGRAARVRADDDPALGGPERRVPAVRPAVLPRALRAAV